MVQVRYTHNPAFKIGLYHNQIVICPEDHRLTFRSLMSTTVEVMGEERGVYRVLVGKP
jgi:hypothetical protein